MLKCPHLPSGMVFITCGYELPEVFASLDRRQEGQRREKRGEEEEEKIHKVHIEEEDLLVYSRYSIDGTSVSLSKTQA